MKWEDLSEEQNKIVTNMYVTTEDRNESDKNNPKLEDVVDYFYDNEEDFEQAFSCECSLREEDGYRMIMINIFKGDQDRFRAWLAEGEPRYGDKI